MYNTKISNWDRIWDSQGWYTNFYPIFALNRSFQKNRRLTPLGFESKLDIFQNL
jgi:hypothetical protein